MELSDAEVQDLRALLVWAFMSKPGIPGTVVLSDLFQRLSHRCHELRTAEVA